MSKSIPVFIICLAMAWCGYSQYKVHSHNDYEQKVPFWTALSGGAGSIEVDLFLRNGELFAAHEEQYIQPDRTFESLYLLPLQTATELGHFQTDTLQLLIDLKTEAYATLDAVVHQLEKYRHLFVQNSSVTIVPVISGNRPKAADYSGYPDYVFFDHQSLQNLDQVPMEKVAMISLSFNRFSEWNGKGRIVDEEQEVLQRIIREVHAQGKPVRFWGTPDTKTAWYTLSQLGIDFVNTDHPFEAVDYLRTVDQRIYGVNHSHAVYTPTFQWDGSHQRVKNVILIIGDGMGLAQISAGVFAGGNQSTLTQLKNIGFSKTQSADDFTTDSAAGGTAMATGIKAKNRAIGVDGVGQPVANLPEMLDKQGYVSGIVSTDELTGATPAAFYAHQPDRGMTKEIAADILQSPASLFIGGGRATFFDTELGIGAGLQSCGFFLADDLADLSKSKSGKAAFLATDEALPAKQDGRGDFLPAAMNAALEFLEAKRKPFFLMVEGAFIDWGGHANNVGMVVEETLDLDLTIANALRFADEHKGTLVIVTADHETGGLSLPQGDVSRRQIEGQFYSTDHTGIMVPVFAYGPGSDAFRGVYENTEICNRILKLLSGGK